MWKRLKRLWEMSKYEVVNEHVIDHERMIVSQRPVLKNVEARPKGMATIVDMEDTIARDFKSEEE